MLNNLFANLFSSTETATVEPFAFFLALVASILLGLFSAWVYQYKTVYTKQFVITLAMLPAIVQVVIFLVNGNLGTGMAVMGAFSLIRFRSAPGGAKEILAIFMAMAIGLATGMGYIAFATVFTLIMSVVSYSYERLSFGQMKQSMRQLTITIPESLDYEDVFDDIFKDSLDHIDLLSVRTSDMGSLYKLKYLIQLNSQTQEKELIDRLRTRNGNLEISLSRNISKENEL